MVCWKYKGGERYKAVFFVCVIMSNYFIDSLNFTTIKAVDEQPKAEDHSIWDTVAIGLLFGMSLYAANWLGLWEVIFMTLTVLLYRRKDHFKTEVKSTVIKHLDQYVKVNCDNQMKKWDCQEVGNIMNPTITFKGIDKKSFFRNGSETSSSC